MRIERREILHATRLTGRCFAGADVHKNDSNEPAIGRQIDVPPRFPAAPVTQLIHIPTDLIDFDKPPTDDRPEIPQVELEPYRFVTEMSRQALSCMACAGDLSGAVEQSYAP